MNIEKKSAYYTAVGHFRRRTDGTGRSCPVILVDQEEHLVDIQEMAVFAVNKADAISAHGHGLLSKFRRKLVFSLLSSSTTVAL